MVNRQTNEGRWLLGLLICVCLQAQQLKVPLHLLVHDHNHPERSSPVVGPVGWQRQHTPPAHSEGGASDDSHRPHPAGQHSRDEAPQRVALTSTSGPVFFAEEAPVAGQAGFVQMALPTPVVNPPERPPPRSPAAPRAPPSVA